MGIGLGIGSGSDDSEGGVRTRRDALRTFRGGGGSSEDSDSEDSGGGGAFLGLVRLLRGVGVGFGVGFGTLMLGGSSTASSTGSTTTSSTTAASSTIATGLGRFLLPGGRPGLRVAILDIAIFSTRKVAEYKSRR